FLASGDPDHTPLEERREDRVGVDAADGLDLRLRAGLAIGDDRDRLEHRTGEPWRLAPEQTAHPGAVLREGAELVAAGDADEAEATPLVLEPFPEERHRLHHVAAVRSVERLDEARDRNRCAGREEQAFDER